MKETDKVPVQYYAWSLCPIDLIVLNDILCIHYHLGQVLNISKWKRFANVILNQQNELIVSNRSQSVLSVFGLWLHAGTLAGTYCGAKAHVDEAHIFLQISFFEKT